MKKIFALMLVLAVFWGCVSVTPALRAVSESEEAAQESQENETAGIGYIDPYEEFYIVVPAYWTALGRGSTEQNVADAKVILEGSGVDAETLFESLLSARSPMFVALGKDLKSGLVLSFGSNEYVSNASMLDNIDSIKQDLRSQLTNIRFIDADCGSYSFKSLENILRLHMLVNTDDVDQYYLISGGTMFIFTFLNATEEEKNAAFYFFKTGVTEFDK